MRAGTARAPGSIRYGRQTAAAIQMTMASRSKTHTSEAVNQASQDLMSKPLRLELRCRTGT